MTIASVTDYLFGPREDIDSRTLFVFGTPHHQEEFALRIHELWLAKNLELIVISGHNGEAASISAMAGRLGVPSHLFVLEHTASNTLENVKLGADLLRRRARERSTYLLCKLHAIPRSVLSFRTVLPEWRCHAYGVNNFGVDISSWQRHPLFVEKVDGEFQRIVKYIDKGDLAAPAGLATDVAAMIVALEALKRVPRRAD